MEATSRDWRALKHASPELKTSRSFILEALEIDCRAVDFASEQLRRDPAIVRAVLREVAKQQAKTTMLEGETNTNDSIEAPPHKEIKVSTSKTKAHAASRGS